MNDTSDSRMTHNGESDRRTTRSPPRSSAVPATATAPVVGNNTPRPILQDDTVLLILLLWKSYHRPLVSVPLTVELELSHQKKKNNSTSIIPKHTYEFIVRLHQFLYAFLKQAISLSTLELQPLVSEATQLSSSSSLLSMPPPGVGIDTTCSNIHHPNYIQHPRNSSLHSYFKYATTTNTTHPSKRKVRYVPLSGRRVLVLHHEDFLNELNQYETQSQQPSADFIRNQSYGAFLYHRPSEALASLSCALGLAIMTILMENNNVPHHHHLTSDIHASIPTTISTTNQNAIQQYCNMTQIMVRFVYLQPILPMNDIRTGLVGKLLSVRGHVIKVRPKRLCVATADFVCLQCHTIQTHSFRSTTYNSYNNDTDTMATKNHTVEDGQYSVPTKCYGGKSMNSGSSSSNNNNNSHDSSTNCKSKSFTMIRSTARYVDVQEIRIQEIVEDNVQHVAAGRTPRQMDIVFQDDDLVDICRPGDTVCVAAIVAARRSGTTTSGQPQVGKRAKETSMYHLYLRGHSVTTTTSERLNSGKNHQNHTTNQRRSNLLGNKSQSNGSTNSMSVVYTTQQLRRVMQLCHADHRYFTMTERRAFPFDLLVRSICPAIIGHHMVKVGLLLCLLGGTPPNDGASSQQYSISTQGNSIRSNSHLLIVGDPGMGKSQLLLAATQLAARSVYVGGNTSSTTGLTVTLSKEPGTGETCIEAGALVLADQGVCAIDEFDKMTKNHQDGLLEAMEQQQVSIAKAGVVASLPARCSVIAAANPKHGSYNMSQTVSENINMAKPILSRFDLVFILRDHVDPNLDRMVSSTIMNLYRSKKHGQAGGNSGHVDSNTINENRPSSCNSYKNTNSLHRMSLSARLTWVNDFQKEPLPADLVRDYIAYAREYCKPKLTPEAATILKDYFMELRYPTTNDGQRRKVDTVPITTRQLEALIRLCQARAKACLRDYVLEEDALDVVELMTSSNEQVHCCDEMGNLDHCRGGAGGQSNRKVKKAFVNEIQRIIGIGAECTLDDLVGGHCSIFNESIVGAFDNRGCLCFFALLLLRSISDVLRPR
jgi:DNA helicase MCM8